jgi:hypothetical protein
MKRLLSADPITGVKQYFGSQDGKFHLFQEQDCEEVAEAAKATFNSTDERARWKDWNLVARIPLAIYYDLKKRGVADDPAAMKKWLNERDNRYFRTRPGKV